MAKKTETVDCSFAPLGAGKATEPVTVDGSVDPLAEKPTDADAAKVEIRKPGPSGKSQGQTR